MFKNPDDARTFVLAGHAELTLKSQKTDTHFTYQISRGKKGSNPPWFVSVKPDGYIGVIRSDSLEFHTTNASRLPDGDPRVMAFRYFWVHLLHGNIPNSLEVRHTGSCGCCGRPLTRPESIDRGIGPHCAERMTQGGRRGGDVVSLSVYRGMRGRTL